MDKVRYYLNRLGLNTRLSIIALICNILLVALWPFSPGEPLHNILGVLYLLWWIVFVVVAVRSWKKTAPNKVV